jgi:hypothetical protein
MHGCIRVPHPKQDFPRRETDHANGRRAPLPRLVAKVVYVGVSIPLLGADLNWAVAHG